MSLADEYRAIREHAAIGALAPRRQIAVAGGDRASYLQGLLTNDIQALKPGTGCYAAWLTPQGRMLTDMDVLNSGDVILLDVPAEQADATLQRLDQFVFSEDVQLESMDGKLAGVWLHGPAAVSVLSAVTGPIDGDLSNDYRLARASFGAHALIVARMDRLGVPGLCVYVDPAAEPELTGALERSGGVRAGGAALAAARIAAGYPLFGVDMTDDTIPLEAGIEHEAISFTKGCYVGQEVIIRVLHRGHGRVARRLVGLRIAGPVPQRGARIAHGDRDIGFVTSAAGAPDLGTIALGYVHRDFTAPGTAVGIVDGDVRTAATVQERMAAVRPAGSR